MITTFGELLNKLVNLSEEQLNCNISIYEENADEFFSAVNIQLDFLINNENGIDTDVLDVNHPFFSINFE